ncbi:MAG: cupin domain-containing protein [Bacteroidales bacterium]
MAIYKESESTSQVISSNFSRRVFSLEGLMVVTCVFSGGPAPEPDKPHSHPHEQITYVESGDLYFFLDGVRSRIGKGDVVTIPSGVPHCIQIISPDVKLIDCFSPIRKDFLV